MDKLEDNIMEASYRKQLNYIFVAMFLANLHPADIRELYVTKDVAKDVQFNPEHCDVVVEHKKGIYFHFFKKARFV